MERKPIFDRFIRDPLARHKERAGGISRFTLPIGEDESSLTITTSEQVQYPRLNEYLRDINSKARNVISFHPDERVRPPIFTAEMSDSPTNQHVVFDTSNSSPQEPTTLPTFVEQHGNALDTPAYYLTNYPSHGSVSVNIRLFALPSEALPDDSAFAVSARKEDEEQFTLSQAGHKFTATRADITVTDPTKLPEGMKSGPHLIVAHQELILPGSQPPKEVRILGVSRKEQAMYYKDIDVTEDPPSIVQRRSV